MITLPLTVQSGLDLPAACVVLRRAWPVTEWHVATTYEGGAVTHTLAPSPFRMAVEMEIYASAEACAQRKPWIERRVIDVTISPENIALLAETDPSLQLAAMIAHVDALLNA